MAITTQGNAIGFGANSPGNGAGTQTNNAAATWIGFSFIARESTINQIAIYCNSITGTLTSGNITCSIQAATTGNIPDGSSIETANCDASLAAGLNTWTFSGTSYTVGKSYWAVFKNLNGTPASNFMSVRFLANGSGPFYTLGNTITSPGFHKRHSTDSGATWTAGNVAGSGGIRIKYGSGAYDGMVVNNQATYGSANGVYSTRLLGFKFTTPAAGQFKAAGLNFFILKGSGTPTGNVIGYLYEGSTPSLVATSGTISNADLISSSTGWTPMTFSSSYTMAANTVYRAVYGVSTGGDTSNYFSSYRYIMDTSSPSAGINPMTGTMTLTYYDGSTWTDTSNEFPPGMVLLDSDNPITASGGGGTTYIFSSMD